MTAFLVELYVAQSDAGAVRRDAERARLIAEALSREGTPVRCGNAVRKVIRRADLSFGRVSEVVAEPSDEQEEHQR